MRPTRIRDKQMKKIAIIILMAIMPMLAIGQNAEKELTKFEAFTSKTGSITKFYDVNMPKIPTYLGGKLEASVRVVKKGADKMYFFRVEKAETSSSIARIAMIEYSDLVEVNKAIASLMSEVQSDKEAGYDYLENKFISNDGFQVGYFVSGSSMRWFLKLERYSSSTVFFSNTEDFVDAFRNAQTKIEEMRNQ